MARIKVIAATGLVPVRALVAGTTTAPGDVFGVTPQRLPMLLAKQEVALVDIDDGVEIVEVEIDAPSLGNSEKHDEQEDFALPDGWRSLHHNVLIRLAKRLTPEVSTKADAITVLEAYESALNLSE